MRQCRGQAREHQLRLTPNKVSDGRCNASVGNVHHKAVGLQFEQFGRQMGQGPCACRAIRQAAGVLLHVVHEGLEILRWQAGVDAQHIGG